MEADKKRKAVTVRRALISVSDKTGVVEFAKKLCEMDVEIISTGGTKRVLKEAGVQVLPVSSFTGAPEILDGRVKTLHPAVHGAILYKRDDPDHVKQIREHDMRAIDMVVVNLYPFEETVARPNATDDEIIENIDIGGPSMVRSAAKNHADVVVVTDPAQYDPIVKEMSTAEGAVSYETRCTCAKKAFKLTARYDSMIAAYFDGKDGEETEEFPATLKPEYSRMSSLRYGENPHQNAAIYSLVGHSGPSLVDAQVLAGKELSYNNYNDLESVLGMLIDFEEPFACVVKHTNPCGAAVAETAAEAYKLAYESDPMSAYGSIIGINRFVDMDTAMLLHETPFVECIIAPGYSDEAVAKMQKKKARRLLALPSIGPGKHAKVRHTFIQGGLLSQTSDSSRVKRNDLKVVTKVQPNDEQIDSMLFGFHIVKHVKSNAIVLVQGKQLVGLGCGQTSRVDASLMAAYKAGDRSNGAVLASDAFFPMRDGIDKAAEAGVVAIIQPGGSKRDDEAIEAADEHKMAMVFTGIRHFKH